MDGAENQVLADLADSIEEDKRLEERSRNILLETARKAADQGSLAVGSMAYQRAAGLVRL